MGLLRSDPGPKQWRAKKYIIFACRGPSAKPSESLLGPPSASSWGILGALSGRVRPSEGSTRPSEESWVWGPHDCSGSRQGRFLALPGRLGGTDRCTGPSGTRWFLH